jgi:murein DD-endopeptidase MepM/ murein hydrolase activator NlpD
MLSLRKKRIVRVISTVLMMVLLLSITAQGGSIDANNELIEKYKRDAEAIAAANLARQQNLSRLRNDMTRQQEFINEVSVQIGQIEAQIVAYINLMNAKQAMMDETAKEIELKSLEITNTETRIAQKERDIELLDEENNENIERFGQVVAQMYMNSGSDAISFLTGSKSFYEVLVQAEMIRNISEKNVEFMENLLEAIARQENAIAELDEDRINLEIEKSLLAEQYRQFSDEMNRLSDEQAAVAIKVQEQYEALAKLAREREEIQSSVNSVQSQINSGVAQIQNLESQVAALERENERIAAAIRAAANPSRTDHTGAGFRWPLDNHLRMVTCAYGCACLTPPRRGLHSGVDIGNGGINGANVYAMNSGTVVTAVTGWGGGYGNYIVIDHGGGVTTLYAHLQNGSLRHGVGTEVEKGDVIGRVGNTGMSFGAHLHFEVRVNGNTVNPMGYVG